MDATSPTALVLCDGYRDIGLGHVSRCIALAEALDELGVACHFHGCFEAGAQELLTGAGFPFEHGAAPMGVDSLCDTVARISRAKPSLAILDSYAIDAGYVAAISEATGATVVIDDFASLTAYPCSAILNPGIEGPRLAYPSHQAQAWLGTEYTLFRRRLRELRPASLARDRNKCEAVLISIGGVDRYDLTLRCGMALSAAAEGLEQKPAAHFVVGKSHGKVEALEALASQFTEGSAVHVQTPGLGHLLEKAGLCICGGGLTKYEAAFMGVPSFVVAQSEDQGHESAFFADRGLCFYAGMGVDLSDSEIERALRGYLRDKTMRNIHIQNMGCLFPADPTLNAAACIYTTLFNIND